MASPDVQLAQLYRTGQRALQAATVRDTLRLWPALAITGSTIAYDAWSAAMGALIDQNVGAANALAASYVAAEWTASEGAGSPQILRSTPAAEQVQTSLRVTSLVAYRRALGAGLTREAASQSALVQVSGSASRLVVDAARSTVADSTIENKGRWQRVPSAGACSFCRMLAGRGAVYRSGMNFASHDHCGCTLVATFGERLPAVDFTPSARAISDADRARVRDWLRANPMAA